MSAAIAGSEVAMIVESMFSMNSATAMMRGTSRSRLMTGLEGGAGEPVLSQGARPIIAERAGVPRYSSAPAREGLMIYILAFFLPPLGLLFNGQPFSAVFSLLLIVFCLIFGWIFPVLFLVPSIHGVVAVAMKREDRRHREIVEAIERHGPPPGYGRSY